MTANTPGLALDIGEERGALDVVLRREDAADRNPATTAEVFAKQPEETLHLLLQLQGPGAHGAVVCEVPVEAGEQDLASTLAQREPDGVHTDHVGRDRDLLATWIETPRRHATRHMEHLRPVKDGHHVVGHNAAPEHNRNLRGSAVSHGFT